MTTATLNPPDASPIRFQNVKELWHALGDVPLERIIMDPLPGTATEEDLLLLCERDKRLCELIDGTLVEKGMGFDESLIASILLTALTTFVRDRRLGFVYGADAPFRVLPTRVRLPDVAFVHVDDLPDGKRQRLPIAQLRFRLAVEVLSKTNTRKEIIGKRKEYFESGTRLMWIIDPPKRTVAVHRSAEGDPAAVLSEKDSFDGEDVLPGFSLPISELFRDEP